MQIIQLTNQKSVLALFNSEKIRNFHTNHSDKITRLSERMKTIQDEYFVIENGNFKMATPEPGQQPQPILLEGKEMKDFNAEMDKLMNEEVSYLQIIKQPIGQA